MDIMKILEAYAAMQNITIEEAMSEKPLAVIAAYKIEKSLKNPEIQSQDKSLLETVAGCLVNLWICSARATSSPSGSFSGNGFTISKNALSEISCAKKLLDEWRATASNLLIDENFVFLSTKEECLSEANN